MTQDQFIANVTALLLFTEQQGLRRRIRAKEKQHKATSGLYSRLMASKTRQLAWGL